MVSAVFELVSACDCKQDGCGVQCAGCDRVLMPGTPFVWAMGSGVEVSVCVYCAVDPEALDRAAR